MNVWTRVDMHVGTSGDMSLKKVSGSLVKRVAVGGL